LSGVAVVVVGVTGVVGVVSVTGVVGGGVVVNAVGVPPLLEPPLVLIT
jgi:hypothetical protein